MLRAVAVFWLCAGCLLCQQQAGQEDIIEKLFVYKDYPRVRELSAAERLEAVNRLEALRPSAEGQRLQKLSFLLAALGSNCAANRDYLLGVLRGCNARKPDCDEDTAALLIGLYNAGHGDVLAPLFAAGLHSDGAQSELLGTFYGDVLIAAPPTFLAGLRQCSAPARDAVCRLTGAGDGGGMESGRFQQAQRILRRPNDSTATRCLRHLEDSTRNASKKGEVVK